MEKNTEQTRKHPKGTRPKQAAGRREEDPRVPPASETWVEGQPTSDADYPK